MSDDGPLIFIDTNIFLDFYRATGSADFKLLGRLKVIHDRIITSAQVEMEFQKNRQKLLKG
jgi:PIN domain